MRQPHLGQRDRRPSGTTIRNGAAVGTTATVLASLLGGAMGAAVVAPAANAATGDPITGTIWQDYDSNGILDTFEQNGRLGGVEVYAYDADGNVAGPAITDADGSYSLTVTSDATEWRVEANVPDTPEWAEWHDSVVGRATDMSNDTTVQRVTVEDGVGAAGIDFSFQVPGTFVENNPHVFLPAYRYGASDGEEGSHFGGTAHLYDAMSPDSDTVVPMTMQVPFAQIGATYGTAWQRAEEPDGIGSMFASAFVRRHSGLGPGGIGAIYRITPDGADLTSPTASADPLVDITDHGVDVGSDSDPDAGAGDPDGLRPRWTDENPQYDWMRDAQAWDTVGRTGIGGMEISNDQESLFAVNLFHRSLIEIEISRDGTQVLGVQEHELDAYFPDDGDLRPFGVSANPRTNEMYLTATNTAEASGNRADLHAYVFAFDPADPTELREVLTFPLGYDRGTVGGGLDVGYQPWSTDSAYWAQFAVDNPRLGLMVIRTSVPMVAEARYLHGDLIVGIRDVGGDLFGSYTNLAPDDDTIVGSRSFGGDLLKAGPNGDGTWTIEQDGVVNGEGGAGAGTGSGMNGPYGDDKFFVDYWHQDAEHLGTTLVVPSREDGILETGIHVAEASFQVGTRRLFQDAGATVEPRGAAIMTGTDQLSATLKGNGLGELTAMASAAPIEIGNYIWYDIDNDGVQDPDEPVVDDATVNLYEVDGDGNRTLVSTTTTDANGEYYFSSDPALNDDDYALRTNTDYVVGVDNPDDYAAGGPLENWYPTIPDTGDPNSVDADRNDSDGIVEETEEGTFPYAAITTGGPGENDHTIDFGYSNIDYEFDKRTVSGPTENPDDDGTWSLTYELVVENTGMIDGSYGLTDDLTGYGDGIEVVDTQVVSGPTESDGLLNPDWDGTTDLNVITDEVPIEAQSTVDNGTEHVYTLEVTVALTTDPDTGETTADPGNLACTPDQVPGDPTTGLFNSAVLDPSNHEDIQDDECGDLPLVTLDKTVEVEPYVVDRENLPGVWEIAYGLTVTNEGTVATDYDLEDRLRFGAGIEIVDGSVVAENTDPGGIATRPEFDGVTDTLIVSDEPIEAEVSHQYVVTVRFTVDLPDGATDPDPSDCSLVGGEGGEEGTGLYNDARSSFNGYPDHDDECREVGEVTHDKTLISATPIGDGQWEVVYGIEVRNKGVAETFYDLDDELLFTDQVTIVSTDVTEVPDGVTPHDPTWNGVDQIRVAEGVTIPGTDDTGYAPHEYVLTVVADAPLQLESGEDGSDPTACPGPDDPSANSAFNNRSVLTDEAGDEEEDTACAELPSVDLDKTISAGPLSNGDGTWTVTYDIEVSNDGSAAGEYTVSDRLRFGEGIGIESTDVVTTPDGVTALPTWTGQGDEGADENVIAVDVPIDAGATHLYQLEVVVTLDEDVITDEEMQCPEPGSGENGGLANGAELEHNDLTDVDEDCRSLGQPDLDKELVSAAPIGDGQWEVVYELTVHNLRVGETTYDISDELLFGDGVEVDTAEVVSAPGGVTTRDDWDGVDQLVIAEDVPLVSLLDEGYAPHVYTVHVVADVPLSFTSGDGAPSAAFCAGEPGDNLDPGGLNNAATITDEGGDTVTDTDCPHLPSITLDKTVSDGPTPQGDGRYEVVYRLEVANDGGAAGSYVLRDQLRYGAGLEVIGVETANVDPGDVETLDSYTGTGAELAAAENAITGEEVIDAGDMHVFEVTVLVGYDVDAASAESLTCSDEPGEGAGAGLLNVGSIGHNDLAADSDACITLEPPAPPSDPSDPSDPSMPDTGGPSAWMMVAGLVLLLGGAALVATVRRRTAGATSTSTVGLDDLF